MPRLGWLTRRSLPCEWSPRRYDATVAGTDPGARSTPGEAPRRRVLERPPSERYGSQVDPTGTQLDSPPGSQPGSALRGPLLRALVIGAAGAALLVLVSAVLASTVGLLLISAGLGSSVGLVLARAASPTNGARPIARRSVLWLALALTLTAIVAAFFATWLYARSEGGVLEPLDYLLTTFGLLVPGQLLFGSVAAAWGATAGPVQR